MKLLHLVAGNLFGGVETVLLTHALNRHLCPGLDPHFAVCFTGRFSDELRATGAPVHVLGATRLSRPWTVFQARKRLEDVLAQNPFDAVICHMSWVHALFGSTVRNRRLPLIAYLHGKATGTTWPERWARRIPPNCVIAVSKDTASSAKLVFNSAPVEVCYSPLPVQSHPAVEINRAEIRQRLNTPANCRLIIQVSRMEAGKGHNNLLDTLALLKSVPDWHCWIVGGAQRAEEISYAGQLKSKAAELGISERVLFLGERKDVRQLMAASDFYFQPNSGPEGFSIVFMEALLSELPIITSDMGGAPELIDDSCGFLIKPSDLNAFAAAVEALIVDPRLCASLGRAGREKVHALCDTARQLERFKDLCIKYSAETNS